MRAESEGTTLFSINALNHLNVGKAPSEAFYKSCASLESNRCVFRTAQFVVTLVSKLNKRLILTVSGKKTVRVNDLLNTVTNVMVIPTTLSGSPLQLSTHTSTITKLLCMTSILKLCITISKFLQFISLTK